MEITSFRQSHEAMEQILEQWRDHAIDLLADINVLKDQVSKNPEELTQAAPSFNAAADKSAGLEEMLKRIVSLMEKDPYADYSLWMEHKKITENLTAMNQNAVKETSAAFQTNNTPGAQDGLERMAAELERMTALSENLSREQNARDMIDAGRDLETLAESIEKGLASGEDKEIEALIQEAMSVMQDIASLMQKSQKELPEDFVNQEALKDLNLKDPMDMLSQIREALKKGDRETAMKLAKQFLESAQKMKDQISKAHDSYTEGTSNDGLMKQVQEQQRALDDIVSQQQDMLAQTQALESKRLAALFEQQKKKLQELEASGQVLTSTDVLSALDFDVPFSQDDQQKMDKLAQQQAALAEKVKPLKQRIERLSQKSATLGSGITLPLARAMSSMEQASGELSDRKTQAAQRSEENALDQLKQAQQSLQGSATNDGPHVGYVEKRTGRRSGDAPGWAAAVG
jgi:hypothetical protein